MLNRFILRHGPSLLLACLLLAGRISLAETAIAVVVSKDSPVERLSREELADLFLGKRKYSGDTLLTPIDSNDGELRERFYQAAAEMNGVRVKAYWSRIVFSGQGRPPREASLTEAAARLAEESGVLIYLPADRVTAKMKIVFRIP